MGLLEFLFPGLENEDFEKLPIWEDSSFPWQILEGSNSIKEQIAINGGRNKLRNLAFLFNPNLNFLGILVGISVFFILTFGDSFN